MQSNKVIDADKKIRITGDPKGNTKVYCAVATELPGNSELSLPLTYVDPAIGVSIFFENDQ